MTFRILLPSVDADFHSSLPTGFAWSQASFWPFLSAHISSPFSFCKINAIVAFCQHKFNDTSFIRLYLKVSIGTMPSGKYWRIYYAASAAARPACRIRSFTNWYIPAITCRQTQVIYLASPSTLCFSSIYSLWVSSIYRNSSFSSPNRRSSSWFLQALPLKI